MSVFDRIGLYLNRLPLEFRVLCMRHAVLRPPAIRCTAGYAKWAAENHHAIAWWRARLRRQGQSPWARQRVVAASRLRDKLPGCA